jgi:hypothetical protein
MLSGSGRSLKSWEDLGYWECAIEGGCETQVSPLTAFFHFLAMHCCNDVLTPTTPYLKNNGSAWSWPGALKTVSQNKPFLLLSWLSQAFVIEMETHTHTHTHTHTQAQKRKQSKDPKEKQLLLLIALSFLEFLPLRYPVWTSLVWIPNSIYFYIFMTCLLIFLH